MKEDIHLIALSYIPEIGPVSIRKLLSAFGSSEEVFKATAGELSGRGGMSRRRAESISKFTGWDVLRRDIERLKNEGIRVLTFKSSEYPDALRDNEADAPTVLFAKGDVRPEDKFAVAVVGSRRPTHYGLSVTGKIASELASMGFTIVSGLARGIDTAAHKGALASGGRSIAVLGSGIDVPYPPENRGLMEKLSASGCVISEFPPGTPPLSGNFPRRNRIISGLSLGVIVAEAAPGSGALITARYALEQGREVFAVPGNINSSASGGANELIKQGARVLMKTEDVIEELAPVLRGFIKSREKVRPPVTDEEKTLCDIMTTEPIHIDAISRDGGMPPQRALSVLLALELKGVVKQLEGKRFHLA